MSDLEGKVLTQEDLDLHPELAEKGFVVGDTFPVEETPEVEEDGAEEEVEETPADDQPSPEGELPGDGAADNVA